MDSRLIHYVSGKQEIDRRALQTSSKLELEQLADKVIVFFSDLVFLVIYSMKQYAVDCKQFRYYFTFMPGFILFCAEEQIIYKTKFIYDLTT